MRRIFIMANIVALALALPVLAAADGQTRYRNVLTATGQSLPYAVHLPPGFDPDLSYPVLIGPGDGKKGSDPGFYWQTDPHVRGWIIVDTQLWEANTARALDPILDAVIATYNVEGGKFHAVCWSANSAAIFRLITEHAARFHSITGIAGNPGSVSDADIAALQSVKVRFIVGENDSHWQGTARAAHEQLLAGGVDSGFEIVPNGEHVMTNLIGAPFINKLEKLR